MIRWLSYFMPELTRLVRIYFIFTWYDMYRPTRERERERERGVEIFKWHMCTQLMLWWLDTTEAKRWAQRAKDDNEPGTDTRVYRDMRLSRRGIHSSWPQSYLSRLCRERDGRRLSEWIAYQRVLSDAEVICLAHWQPPRLLAVAFP